MLVVQEKRKDGGAVLESTPQHSLRPELYPGASLETAIHPDCPGTVPPQPTVPWGPVAPRLKQHCIARTIRLLVLFLALPPRDDGIIGTA